MKDFNLKKASRVVASVLSLAVFLVVATLGTTVTYARGFNNGPSATIVATKIICDKETDLPNWGLGHANIGEHTASAWVSTHSSCHFASGWNFQYGGINSSYPGDTLVGPALGFTTFGVTAANGKAITSVDLKGDLKNEIHVREVQKDGYIPFTYQSTGNNNTNNVSAEIYCSNDVINYDNFDFIRNPSDNETYYCVAWNVPKETTKQLCTDGIDNDGNGTKDLADNNCAAWRPSVNVIKHVVGGTRVASDFVIHLTNQISFTGDELGVNTIFTTAPVVYQVTEDVTTSYVSTLSGDCQGSLSAGDHKVCTVTNTYVPPQVCPEGTTGSYPECVPNQGTTDVCPNLEEVQSVVPEGYQLSEGQCVQIPPQVCPEGTTGSYPECVPNQGTTDVCPNLEEVQSVVPEGYQLSEGQCVVTPIDVTPPPPSSGGGSSNFDYWGCTNVSATNFNSLANKDDGSCALPPLVGGESTPTGEVLGAATTTSELNLPAGCSPYLTDYLKIGKKNDSEQVKLLQTFLNENMDAKLPISGIFGNMTKSWVKKFQVKHHDEIIKPWYSAGYKRKDIENGTGYVYKTTKYQINLMKCANSKLTETAPDLTPDL